MYWIKLIELEKILKYNYSVDYFIQSKVEKEIQIQGVKVISWNELIKYDDINILFAIRDKSIFSLIKKDVL
jgi:N-acetyl-beta-hexosaminidase